MSLNIIVSVSLCFSAAVVKALCFGKAQTTHTHASDTFCVHQMRQVHAWVAELETCISVHLGLGRRECTSARKTWRYFRLFIHVRSNPRTTVMALCDTEAHYKSRVCVLACKVRALVFVFELTEWILSAICIMNHTAEALTSPSMNLEPCFTFLTHPQLAIRDLEVSFVSKPRKV